MYDILNGLNEIRMLQFPVIENKETLERGTAVFHIPLNIFKTIPYP